MRALRLTPWHPASCLHGVFNCVWVKPGPCRATRDVHAKCVVLCSTPSFFPLCHLPIEETSRLVLWNFLRSALMIDHSPLAFLMALISSGLLSRSLLTPGAGSFFTVGAILCTLGARQYSCLHPPGARNTFLPNQVMTTKSVLWGRITHHHECNSVPYPLAFCEPVAGPGHGFHKPLPIAPSFKALLHG